MAVTQVASTCKSCHLGGIAARCVSVPSKRFILAAIRYGALSRAAMPFTAIYQRFFANDYGCGEEKLKRFRTKLPHRGEAINAMCHNRFPSSGLSPFNLSMSQVSILMDIRKNQLRE